MGDGTARACRPRPGPGVAPTGCPGRRAFATAVVAATAVAALGASAVGGRSPRLVWNATASSPVGLYWVSPASAIGPGDTVLAWPPAAARALGAARGYLPRNVPLVKRIAAAEGDRVCALGATVAVNGHIVAERRATDPHGRPMPWWSGCERVRPGDFLLLTDDEPEAFDGRYFGITHRHQVIGHARLLWAR